MKKKDFRKIASDSRSEDAFEDFKRRNQCVGGTQ